MREVVIVSGVRTPIGKFLGSLRPLGATQLGAIVVGEVIRRAGIAPELVDEVIMGNVISAGLGQNPARQAALFAGLPPKVAAVTINKVCGSGLKAVMLAEQAIKAGDAEIIVAGGMESMSNAPYLLPKAREGLRLGHGQIIDAMVHDGLWDVYENCHMGCTAEAVAEKYGISRRQQDEYALESHRRAVTATKEGRFKPEIVPVRVQPATSGDAIIVDSDECPRADTSLEALSKLRPVFKEGGTVTAGNAPGCNDGAAAVLVMSRQKAMELNLRPMARIVAQATSGIEPLMVMMAPLEAIRRVLAKAGWGLEDVDLFEINEAFAAQSVALIRELGISHDRMNINGGAIALGHPIGASGARILVTLLYAMRRSARGGRGVAALCLGGGNAVALAVEAV